MAKKKSDDNKLMEAYAGSLWQAQIIKGLLDANGIVCMLEDDTLGAVTSPYSGFGGNVKVLVNEDELQEALDVIKENEKEIVNCN